MYLVLRRGAIATLARAGELAGAAAVACLRTFEAQEEHREAIAAWRERPASVHVLPPAHPQAHLLERGHDVRVELAPAVQAVAAL